MDPAPIDAVVAARFGLNTADLHPKTKKGLDRKIARAICCCVTIARKAGTSPGELLLNWIYRHQDATSKLLPFPEDLEWAEGYGRRLRSPLIEKYRISPNADELATAEHFDIAVNQIWHDMTSQEAVMARYSVIQLAMTRGMSKGDIALRLRCDTHSLKLGGNAVESDPRVLNWVALRLQQVPAETKEGSLDMDLKAMPRSCSLDSGDVRGFEVGYGTPPSKPGAMAPDEEKDPVRRRHREKNWRDAFFGKCFYFACWRRDSYAESLAFKHLSLDIHDKHIKFTNAPLGESPQ